MVIQQFNLEVPEEISEAENNEACSSNTQHRKSWTRHEIIKLITLFKEYKSKFQSTTIRNDKVWQEISTKMSTHSWEQCKNKFKYLKSKYVEKKDNMGTKSSGAHNVKFEYFEEMDEIFGKDPNIKPVGIASSSKGIENLNCLNNETENLDLKQKQKLKDNEKGKENAKKFKGIPIGVYKEIQVMKENGRNQRHKEQVKVLKDLVSAITDLANSPNKV